MMTSPSRLEQYKNTGRSPANFRDSLRKKCLERIRETRSERQNSRRNLNFDHAEKNILRETVAEEMYGASFDEQMIMLEELMEEVQREVEEYETQLAEEEESLAAHLEPDAFCPACKLNPMRVDNTGCRCEKCGFEFQFKNNFIPTQSVLAARLLECFQIHGNRSCSTMPDPVITTDGLHLVCNNCNHSQRII